MKRLCAAPTRAWADPDWDDIDDAQGIREPQQQDAFVINHLADGVTNSRVLDGIRAWRESWRQPSPERVAELDQLLHESGFLATCELRDYWAGRDAQSSP